MDDHLDAPELKMGANELLAFQRDLKEEKELLLKLLTKIDDQVHRLQVEQLSLLAIMNKSLKEPTKASLSSESEQKMPEDISNKSLNLSIATALQYMEEENDDEDDI